MKVLFVCTGNTCRSPMAEAMFRQLASEEGLNVEVKSAGIAALAGMQASKNTDLVLQNRGIALSHTAQALSPALVEWAGLILTMTVRHKDAVVGAFSTAAAKTYTIGEFAEVDLDIHDPFGGSLEVYRETERELEEILRKIVKKIQR